MAIKDIIKDVSSLCLKFDIDTDLDTALEKACIYALTFRCNVSYVWNGQTKEVLYNDLISQVIDKNGF